MSNSNLNDLTNMFKKTTLRSPVSRRSNTLKKGKTGKLSHYSNNFKSTARRNTQRKGVKTYSRANAATARRRKAAATAKAARSAAKKEKRNANKAAEREKVIIQGRTRSHQKELSKNQEMK
jgi:hypothetical protein